MSTNSDISKKSNTYCGSPSGGLNPKTRKTTHVDVKLIIIENDFLNQGAIRNRVCL